MTAAHTPGPWFLEKQPYDSSSFYIRGSDASGKRLTWGKGAVAHIPRSTVMPMEANARLIAAAPRVLEALRRAEMALLGYTHRNDIIQAALNMARSAIVMAEGDDA